MTQWYLNPYFLAFYGLLAYIILEWSLAKSRYQRRRGKLAFSKYAKSKYDQWIVALILTPIIVWFGPDILMMIDQFFGWEIKWEEVMYMMVGVLVHWINYVIKKINAAVRSKV